MGKGLKLQVTDWKDEMVYLFQFPRTNKLPNMSPFCLKVEGFLRLHKIAHEIRETMKARSDQGLLPFIELNGRQIGDSALIIDHLKKHFNIQDYSNPREAALGRTIAVTADAHSFNVVYKYKLLDHPKEFVNLMVEGKVPKFIQPVAAFIGSKVMHSKASKRIGASLGNFPDVTFEKLLEDNLQMYDDLLKNGKYIFGDKITEADLAVFSQLATCVYIPIDIVPKKLINEKYGLLREYVDRIRNEIWGDEFERKPPATTTTKKEEEVVEAS